MGCITQTGSPLPSGACTTTSCVIPTVPGNRDIYVVPDDDGTGQSLYRECWENNNSGHAKGITRP